MFSKYFKEKGFEGSPGFSYNTIENSCKNIAVPQIMLKNTTIL